MSNRIAYLRLWCNGEQCKVQREQKAVYFPFTVLCAAVQLTEHVKQIQGAFNLDPREVF